MIDIDPNRVFNISAMKVIIMKQSAIYAQKRPEFLTKFGGAHPSNETDSDELVPSRYALRIGDLDVLVVSDGVLPLPTETMSTNVALADRTAWFESMFLGPDAYDWALNVLVVRSGDQTILVDAGLGGQFPGFPRAGQFPQRLAAAGIDLASITDVVLTHMHMDHIGGLLIDEVKDRLSPDLRIHVAAAEVEFWKSPDFTRTVMPSPIPDVLRSTAAQFVNEYGNKLRTFEEEYEVAPGVVVERTGGHTPGHSVVRLTSGGERLTFAGDALFPVAFDHPDWQNGFEHDPEEAVRVRVRLMQEAAASGELLVATHLPFPSVGRVAVEGDTFRWVTGFWDY
jgi:glyoxylase-like metal-dependent hydrolase (beta-lactamase superfamily II)